MDAAQKARLRDGLLDPTFGDLRGDHPWIPGVHFVAHPELQALLIQFIEEITEDES